MTTDEKANKLGDLKFDNSNNEIMKKKASLVATLEIAEACKTFEEGEFLKKVMLKILNCFGKKGKEMAYLVNQVALSRTTVTRQIENISKSLSSVSAAKINSAEYFSIVLDESTDRTNASQLMILSRSVDVYCEVTENLLFCIPSEFMCKNNNIKSQFKRNVSNCRKND